jgi:hypothetical protein
MTDLASRILEIVAANPGLSTNVLCREVRARKGDILAELERLRHAHLLRVEHGYRASKCWYVVPDQGNQFPTCSGGTPARRSDVEMGTAT